MSKSSKINANTRIEISPTVYSTSLSSDNLTVGKDNPLLSVVIPCYNTEEYLGKCLDSLVNSTYKNIEVIVVDDASSGNVKEIVAKYSTLCNVKLVCHTKNMGLFAARITGIKAATGMYFSFIDSDDYVSIDFFRLLIKKAIETDSDIVIGDIILEYEDLYREYCNLDNIRLLDLQLQNNAVLDGFMQQRGLCYSWHIVCGKVYKRELWLKCLPNLEKFSKQVGHLVMAEDIAFSSTLWSNAKKVTNVHNIAYFYFQRSTRSTAVTSEFDVFEKKVKNVVAVFDYFAKVLGEKLKIYNDDYTAWKERFAKILYGQCQDVPYKMLAIKSIKTLFKIEKLTFENSNDWFFYSQKTRVSQEFEWYDGIKSTIIDNNTEYVSFDIFDTLFLRPFYEPSDLFCLMSSYFMEITNAKSQIDYRRIRRESEKNCHLRISSKYPSYEDITLDEIYEQMRLDYHFEPQIIELLKQKELELELKFCSARKSGKELYDLAIAANKKVIIISDMYLPLTAIEKMLDKAGYSGYYKVFMSSECRVAKWTGNLYKYMLADLNITNPSTVIHIGDNWQSDVVMAQKYSMQSAHLAKPIDMFKNINPGIYSGKYYDKLFCENGQEIDGYNGIYGFLGQRCMLGIVANKIFDYPYISFNASSDFNADPYFIGYFALGMHLYGVTSWLLLNTIKDKNDTIHFVARDGYVPKKAYDILAKKHNNAPKSNYLYLSRKALALLDVCTKVDIYSIIDKMNIYNLSPKNLIEYFYIAIKQDLVEKLEAIVKNAHFIYEKNFSSITEYNKFIAFLIDNVLDFSLLENNKLILKEYFASIIKPNDVLFDIGYGGRAEAALSNVLGYPVNSYYIHTNNEMIYLRGKKYKFNNNTFYNHKPAITGIVREHLFMEQAPSTIGFDISNNKITPMFEKYESLYQTQFVTDMIQNAAIDFVTDFSTVFDSHLDDLNFRIDDVSAPYEYFLHYAKEFDRNIFDTLVFEDDLGEGKKVKVTDFWRDEIIRLKLNISPDIAVASSVIVKEQVPHELNELYTDGLFMRFYRKMNSWYPKGSKKRERLKKIAAWFIK